MLETTQETETMTTATDRILAEYATRSERWNNATSRQRRRMPGPEACAASAAIDADVLDEMPREVRIEAARLYGTPHPDAS